MHAYQVPDKDKTREIGRMMEAYSTRLLRLCILYLRDMSLAEDALQETFVKAYKALDDFRGHSAELTWLTTIAVNTCRNLLRTPWHRYVDRSVALSSLPEPGVPCEPYDDSVLREVLALPVKYREVILLYYYQELTVREVAQALGLTEPAVNARLRRAKRLLKPTLERWMER